MNNNEGKSTAGAITEKPIFVFFGMIPFLVRPMTLAQIWQIGEKIGDIEEINIEGEFNPYQKVFSMFKDVKNANEITPIIVFRSRLMRRIFGRFIRKRMTMKKYNELLQYASLSFDASFFLQRGRKISFFSKTLAALRTAQLPLYFFRQFNLRI